MMGLNLFFYNDGTVTNRDTGELLGNVAEIDVAAIANEDIQVMWPVHFGAPAKSHADVFLLMLDYERRLPVKEPWE